VSTQKIRTFSRPMRSVLLSLRITNEAKRTAVVQRSLVVSHKYGRKDQTNDPGSHRTLWVPHLTPETQSLARLALFLLRLKDPSPSVTTKSFHKYTNNQATMVNPSTTALEGRLFCLGRDDFPCNAKAIELVSLGIAAAGLALIFVFWLMQKVRGCYSCWAGQGSEAYQESAANGTRPFAAAVVSRAWCLVWIRPFVVVVFGLGACRRRISCMTSSLTHSPLLSSSSILDICLSLSLTHYCTQVKQAPRGNDLMNNICDKIKSGARAFLVTEYKYLSMFVAVVFAVLVILYSLDPPSEDRTDGIRYGACFLCGALLSGLAGWGGMAVATDCNVRTTQAADKDGLAVALRVAFTGGAVMGFTVVGLGLLGVSLMFYLVSLGYDDVEAPLSGGEVDLAQRLIWASDTLAGFGFGASSIALFARVAGGIYTKAADVGADLVGKVEMDIPEDDPRNPAVIADNVGDNVGDVAGMGADLFESFVSGGGVVWCVCVCTGCIRCCCWNEWISFRRFTCSQLFLVFVFWFTGRIHHCCRDTRRRRSGQGSSPVLDCWSWYHRRHFGILCGRLQGRCLAERPHVCTSQGRYPLFRFRHCL